MEQKRFQTKDGSIVYWICRTDERAPWLVFLPGLTADHTLFEKQMAYFADRYNCLVWDAPAHGLSRPFALTFTMRDLAKDLRRIFALEGIAQPVLIGQSLGGYIAQMYMELYPQDVLGFVSIDSAPLSRRYYSGWELWLLHRTGPMYRLIPWKLLLWWGVMGTAKTPYGRGIMKKTWSAYEREEFCALSDHGFRMLAEAVEQKAEYLITCPSLLICGEKDAAGSSRQYNRRWAKAEGRRLVWIRGAGHNANTDAHDEVNRLIEGFVKEI